MCAKIQKFSVVFLIAVTMAPVGGIVRDLKDMYVKYRCILNFITSSTCITVYKYASAKPLKKTLLGMRAAQFMALC